jgi:hypothetical protein
MLKMKKSSRFWWLHGAILLAAAVGCKSSSSQYGAPPTVHSGPGPIGSASGQMVSQTTPPGYGSVAAAQGMQNMSNAFPSSFNGGTPAPNMSSSMSTMSPGMSGLSGMGGVR